MDGDCWDFRVRRLGCLSHSVHRSSFRFGGYYAFSRYSRTRPYDIPSKDWRRDSDEVRQALKWIEGNDDVKVLGVWISGPLHRVFTLLEANDFDAVSALLRDQMLIGKAEVLPVSDAIARRKQGGHWGT